MPTHTNESTGAKRPVNIHVVTTRPHRRAWLKKILVADPIFTIVGDSLDVTTSPLADLYLVDMENPIAVQPLFWMELSVLAPRAGRMAILDTSVDKVVLEAVLRSTAHVVTWQDPPQRFRRVARAAVGLAAYIPLSESLAAMIDVFDQFKQKAAAPERLQVDLIRNELRQGLTRVELSRVEFGTLRRLAVDAGQVVPFSELHPRPQTWYTHKADNALRVIINRLRKKIEPDPEQPHYIRLVSGRGYYLPEHLVTVIKPSLHVTTLPSPLSV